MADHTIRALDHTQNDVARDIHKVMMPAYRVEAKLLQVRDFPPLQRTVAQIAGADDSSFLGAFGQGAQLLAVAEIEIPQAQPTFISSLVVLPLYFRRGLATALVEHVIERHGERGVMVSTGAGNQPALSLFIGLSFAEHRRWSQDDGTAMVTLRREPASAL